MLILSYGSEAAVKHININLSLDDFKVDQEVKYNHVIISSDSTLVSHEKILEIMACLEVHGKITIKYQGGVRASDAETEMKLCGLLSVVSKVDGEAVVEVEGIKPDFSSGAVPRRRPIKRPSKDALKALLTSEPTKEKELIDDSNLLKEEDLIRPVTGEGEECGPKAKKKACKNCSCGLKEVEEAESAAIEDKDQSIDTTNVKSSCGSVRR